MHRILAILLAAASMAIAMPAGATHECVADDPSVCPLAAACRRGQDWIATPEAEISSADGPLYVDIDQELMPDPFLSSAWIYEETNDVPGLQRADVAVDTTCAGHVGIGDTVVAGCAAFGEASWPLPIPSPTLVSRMTCPLRL